jgi:hypothetical protein
MGEGGAKTGAVYVVMKPPCWISRTNSDGGIRRIENSASTCATPPHSTAYGASHAGRD